MRGTGVAVGASVFTSAVGIQARFKPDIGALIVRDDCSARIFEELRRRSRRVVRGRFTGVRLKRKPIETVGRIAAGSSA